MQMTLISEFAPELTSLEKPLFTAATENIESTPIHGPSKQVTFLNPCKRVQIFMHTNGEYKNEHGISPAFVAAEHDLCAHGAR